MLIFPSWINDTGSEQQQYVRYEERICFYFAQTADASVIDFHEVAFYIIPHFRITVPAKKIQE